MIVTVTLSPALDKTVHIPDFTVGKVNRIAQLRLDAGGKGINVSKVLKVLGSPSTATGILGGSTGRWIEEQLESQGIPHDFVHVPFDTRTNLKVIDEKNHTNTDINEPGEPVSESVLGDVFMRILVHAAPGDRVAFAGKAPTGTDPTVMSRMISSLRERGIHTYLDADADLLIEGAAARPELIKPNDEELSRLTGRTYASRQEIAEDARMLNRRGIRTVVVSLGADGALFARDEVVLSSPGLKVPVLSTVGAGDSMMAAFCHGDENKMDFAEECRLAIAVSAASVMQSGTQPPPLSEVERLLPHVTLHAI